MSNQNLIEKLRRNPRGIMFELEHECADALEKAEAALGEADVKLKNYEEQARSFHEEYRRKCDIETKNLEVRLAAIIEKNAPEIEKINNHLNEMQAALGEAVAR